MTTFEDDDIDPAMRALAAALPSLRPGRDLWPGIAARIAARGGATLAAPVTPPVRAIPASRVERSWRWVSSHAVAATVVIGFVGATYVATRLSLGPGVAMTLAAGRSNGETALSQSTPAPRPAPATYAAELSAINARSRDSVVTTMAWSREAQRSGNGPLAIDTVIGFAGDGGIIDLGIVAGEISVNGWDRSEAKIHAASHGPPIQATLTSNRIELAVHPHHDDSDVTFDLTVPFGTRVISRSVSGDVRVHGIRGDLDAQTVSGDADITDVGASRLETVSGSVRIHGVGGNLHVESVSGDLDLADVRGSDVDIATVSGDVTLPTSRARTVSIESISGNETYGGAIDPVGRYAFHSHSGDITLRLPADVGAVLSIDTFSGSIDSDFPVALNDSRRFGPGHHADVTLGQGGGRVTVETFSGDVALKRTGD